MGVICLGFPRGGKTGPVPLGGAGLGPDYFAERRHAQRCVLPLSLTPWPCAGNLWVSGYSCRH